MCSSDQIRVRFSCCTSFMLCQYQYVEILHRLENRFMDSPCVCLIKRKHCAAAIDMPDRRSTINPAIAFVNAYMISDTIPQVFIHRTDSISFTAVRAKKGVFDLPVPDCFTIRFWYHGTAFAAGDFMFSLPLYDNI